MKIFLMRHGQTDHNKERKIQGSLINPSLNEKGINQAKEASTFLKDKNITHIYSTELIRAKETAKIINEELDLNLDIKIDNNFLERNFGSQLEGMSVDDYYLLEDFSSYQGYESNEELEERILNAIDNIKSFHNKEDNILIVAHSHTIKSFLIKKEILKSYQDPYRNCQIIEIDNDTINKIN